MSFNAINLLIQFDLFLCIIEKIDLVVAGHEIGEADAYEPDKDASGVKFDEKFADGCKENVILVGWGNRFLDIVGLEISIADLNGNATCEAVITA